MKKLRHLFGWLVEMRKNKINYSIVFLLLIFNCLRSNTLKFHQSKDTLETIKNIITSRKKGAYLRFGDGDVALANGSADMLQKCSKSLQKEMREAFLLQGENIIKALPLHCKELNGFEIGMFPGNHERSYKSCLELINKAKPFWGGTFIDVYSPVALHFTAAHNMYYCIEFLKFLRQQSCVFIGNKNVPSHIRNLLFGNETSFIPTPSENSYNEIDRIEQECLHVMQNNTHQYTVIVLAMGCSGRPLQKRLLQKLDNIFLFDFGSLMDALCGWDTRAWILLSKFNRDQFLKLLKQNVKILFTAALIDNQFEMRKKEYIHSLNLLFSFGYKPYICEARKPEKTFFDEYIDSDHLYYAQSNNDMLKNKGVNEVKLMRAALKHYNFDDDDMIIKLTGRYYLTTDFFIKIIEQNPDIDVIIKKNIFGSTWCGCYAMRCRYLKEMLNSFDLIATEKNMIGVESEITSYLNRKITNNELKVKFIDELHVNASIFGNGKPVMTYW